MKKIRVILIGAGSRGHNYTDVMLKMPEQYQVVAVADPIESKRSSIRDKHSIQEEMCFDDWKPLLGLGKIADLAIIATMDRDHLEPALEAIALGYDLLLEKPIGVSPEECRMITEAAEAHHTRVVLGTVLRYTPLFCKLKELIDSGTIGKIVSITHEECVGNHHHSHSFARGNWGNEARSSNMLLQKSCHDLDLLQWLIGKRCKKVQSFGSLTYFVRENAPEGSPEYCIEGCPVKNCRYNAVERYLHLKHEVPWAQVLVAGKVNPSYEDVEKALHVSQFGKCVFKCDNDVVDHQTVNMLFEDDITVMFNMCSFNKGGRFIHVMGTDGEIRAALDGETPITVYDFTSWEYTKYDINGIDGVAHGHGGGDNGIVHALYEYLNGTYTGSSIPEIRQSYENHMIAFAAEESRKNGTVVDFDAYLDSFETEKQ